MLRELLEKWKFPCNGRANTRALASLDPNKFVNIKNPIPAAQ